MSATQVVGKEKKPKETNQTKKESTWNLSKCIFLSLNFFFKDFF